MTLSFGDLAQPAARVRRLNHEIAQHIPSDNTTRCGQFPGARCLDEDGRRRLDGEGDQLGRIHAAYTQLEVGAIPVLMLASSLSAAEPISA